jgi:hypothetical protein
MKDTYQKPVVCVCGLPHAARHWAFLPMIWYRAMFLSTFFWTEYCRGLEVELHLSKDMYQKQLRAFLLTVRPGDLGR